MPTKVCSDCGEPFTQLTKRKGTRCRNCQIIVEAQGRRDSAIERRERLLAVLGDKRAFAESLLERGIPVERACLAARTVIALTAKTK